MISASEFPMEPNAAFFVALLAKGRRTYTSFKSQTVLTTHHLLRVTNHGSKCWYNHESELKLLCQC